MKKLLSYFSLLSTTTLFALQNGEPFEPQIAMNASGQCVVVWSSYNGTNFVIQKATLAEGMSWSAPEQISANGYDALYPELALNNAGDILFVWQRYNGSYKEIQACTSTFGGATNSPVSLSLEDSSLPEIGIDTDGNGIVVWQVLAPSIYAVQTASYSATHDDWTLPLELDTSPNFFTLPDIAVHPSSGRGVAIWQGSERTDVAVQASTHAFGGSWSSIATLSPIGVYGTNPRIAYNTTGEALAVWQQTNSSTLNLQVASFISNNWSNHATLSVPGSNTINPQVAINSSGSALIAAECHTQGRSTIIAAIRNTGGSWSDFTVISGATQAAVTPQVALNASGQGVVIWKDKTQTNGVIYAATLSSGGVWSAPTALSQNTIDSTAPHVMMTATGYAVATWLTGESTHTIQASLLASFGGSWSAPETISD